MWKCSNCGCSNNDNSNYCCNCGNGKEAGPSKKKQGLSFRGAVAATVAAVVIITSLFLIRSYCMKISAAASVTDTVPTASAAGFTTAPAGAPSEAPADAPTAPPTAAPAVKESFLMRAGETLAGEDGDQWEKQYFWGQEKYKREDVTRVVFYDSLQGIGSSGWDISQNGDGTVWAWMDGSTLCIAANGRVALNQNVSCLFAGFVNLREVQFHDAIDTSRVENMSRMFSACNSLTSLDVSSFETSRVTDMSHMFAACEALTALDLSSFDTSRVEDMESMFYGCNNLTSLNLNSFDTSGVRNMVKMFAYCGKLTTIDVSGFDTRSVTDMSHMFRSCSSLRSVDVSGFNTSNVTKINSMFYKCKSLSSVDLRGFDTSRMYGLCYVLQGCPLISNIEVGNWVIASNAQYTGFMDEGDTVNGIPWEEFFKG